MNSKFVEVLIDPKEVDTGDSVKETTIIDDDSPEWAQALEPVRKLPTNVGARIRRCIHDSLTKNPPEWAKQMLEHSISKEVYKGNASGPTKVRYFFKIFFKMLISFYYFTTNSIQKTESGYHGS